MSNSLAMFVALLALDGKNRDNFLANPNAQLEAAGLAQFPQVQRLKGELRKICKALSLVDFPLPTHDPEGGG